MIGTSISKAKKHLLHGEVIAIPTETVYGLAGNAYEEKTIKEIYKTKQRPYEDPLIVHTSTISRLEKIITHWPAMAKKLANKFWPGPLTLLLPKNATIPNIVTAQLPRVGVRIPSHPMAQSLLAALPFPLAAPSANPFGYISPTTAQHVADQLGKKISYILDGGPCSLGLESTIIGFHGEEPLVYRLGSIPIEAISEIVGNIAYHKIPVAPIEPLHAPGTLLRHYAPRARLVVGNLATLIARYQKHKIGVISFDKPVAELPPTHQVMLSAKGNLDEAAQRLFAALRYLDTISCDVVLAPHFPAVGLGRTINERLLRASYQEV